MKSIFLVTTMVLALGVAGCNRHKVHNNDVMQGTEQISKAPNTVVVASELSLESLDKRLQVVEARNARIDAKIKARKAAGK